MHPPCPKTRAQIADARVLDALLGLDSACISVFALGGFGRGRLWAHSDLDLLIVSDDAKSTSLAYHRLWRVLADLTPSILTHTCSDLTKAAHNIHTASSFLHARRLFGEAPVNAPILAAITHFDTLSAFTQALKGARGGLDGLDACFAPIAYAQNEPNIKHTRGNMRDCQIIAHIRRFCTLKGVASPLTAAQCEVYQDAFTFLSRLRTQMHRRHPRFCDHLLATRQRHLAYAMGFANVDTFMRVYFGHTRRICQLVDALLSPHLSKATRPPNLTQALKTPKRFLSFEKAGRMSGLCNAFDQIRGQIDPRRFFNKDGHTLALFCLLGAGDAPLYHKFRHKHALHMAMFCHNLGEDTLKRHINAHSDRCLARFWVQEYGHMHHLIQKKDLDDAAVISQFGRLVGTKTRLDGLYILSVLEMQARHPKRNCAWGGLLLKMLYQKTLALLGTDEHSADKTPELLHLIIAQRDKGLFMRATSVFDRLGLDVLQATIKTQGDLYHHKYWLSNVSQLDPRCIHRALQEHFPTTRFPTTRRALPYKSNQNTKVHWHNQGEVTQINIQAGNRPRLLLSIADYFAQEGISLHKAHIMTLGDVAQNWFHVTHQDAPLPPNKAHALCFALRLWLDGA